MMYSKRLGQFRGALAYVTLSSMSSFRALLQSLFGRAQKAAAPVMARDVADAAAGAAASPEDRVPGIPSDVPTRADAMDAVARAAAEATRRTRAAPRRDSSRNTPE